MAYTPSQVARGTQVLRYVVAAVYVTLSFLYWATLIGFVFQHCDNCALGPLKSGMPALIDLAVGAAAYGLSYFYWSKLDLRLTLGR